MEMYRQLSLFDNPTMPRFRTEQPVRLIELFAGIGSQAAALKRAGISFEHYRVVEFDKYAIKSYNAIHGTDFPHMDITQISAEDLNITDTDKYCYVLTYSFPCQDLSTAGKGRGMAKGTNTRSGLIWEVGRLIKTVRERPQIMVMENVPQIHSHKNSPNFQDWIRILEEMGYSNFWKDLNAKDYGIPQSRNRCFMVSILGRWSYEFPRPEPLRKSIKDYTEGRVEEKYFIKNERAEGLIKKLYDEGVLKAGMSDEESRISDDFIMDGNFNQRGKVHGEYGICRTIIGSGHSGNEPKILTFYDGEWQIRKLTPKESWRLMGFCDADFERAAGVNSNTQLYKQAENAIVVDVLEKIARQLGLQGKHI